MIPTRMSPVCVINNVLRASTEHDEYIEIARFYRRPVDRSKGINALINWCDEIV